MGALIYSQWLSIGKSKRLVGTLLFAPFLFLACSYYSNHSWIPPEYVLVLFAGLISILSSEILHWLTIDEIKDGTFDVILISPLSPLCVLVGKLFIPILGAVFLVLISLLINNTLSLYFQFASWSFSIGTSIFLLFGSVLAGLIEFVALIIMRRKNTNIHSILMIAELLYMLWAYDLLSKGMLWGFGAAILLVPIVLMMISTILLRKRYQIIFSRKKVAFFYLFSEKRLSVFGAFLRKNIAILRFYKHSHLHFIIALVIPILTGAVAGLQTYIHAEWAIALTLSAIPAVSNMFFVYYSSIHENRNKMSEVLHAASISSFYSIAEKSLSAGLISSVSCIIVFLASYFSIGSLDLPFLCGTILNNFLSAFLCGFCFHRVKSFKSEYVSKIFISLISILLQGVALIIR